MEQSLGIGGPESVDALVLIPNHKEVLTMLSQQGYDTVLDFRGVLGLVHTEVAISLLKVAQNWRTQTENFSCVHHLVVIVHLLLLLQGLIVSSIQGWKLHSIYLHLLQCIILEHLVFSVGDGSLYGLDGAFSSILLGKLMVQAADQGTLLSGILHQGIGLASCHALITRDNTAAHPIDGAKLQPLGILSPKECRKSSTHVLGCRDRVGHGEDGFGCNATSQYHVADAAD